MCITPIAVRSSSLFEDSHYQPFAGLYKTYMLPNTDTSTEKRLEHLITAVKLVYASTYLKAPRSYAPVHHAQNPGRRDGRGAPGDYRYPAQKLFLPFYLRSWPSPIISIPLPILKRKRAFPTLRWGWEKLSWMAEKTLRFCPKYPQFLPQFSMIDDIMENAQKYFYALKMDGLPSFETFFGIDEDPCVTRLDIADAKDHPAVRMLCSSYNMQDDRIRDRFIDKDFPVLTFANILKHNSFPLADILTEATALGARWMGTSVEVEFAVDLPVEGVRSKARASPCCRSGPWAQYKQNIEGNNYTKGC